MINFLNIEDQLRKLKRFRITRLLIPVYQRFRNTHSEPPTTQPNPMVAPNYAEWLKVVEPAFKQTARCRGTTISIVMPLYKPDLAFLESAIASVKNQTYRDWELCLFDDASESQELIDYLEQQQKLDPRIKFGTAQCNSGISSATNHAVKLASGRFIAFMDQDDLLTPDALASVHSAIETNSTAKLIYSDEDKLNAHGEREIPHFKPDFNYQLLLSQNYICHLMAIDRSLFIQIGGCRSEFDGAQDHDLVLRITEQIGSKDIVHIPRILYHWRAHANSTASDLASKPLALDAGRRAIEAHLARIGTKACVTTANIRYRVKYKTDEEPLVSIIIPTRNGGETLRRCIDSIRHHTSYQNYQILIVDNGSDQFETLRYLKSVSAKGVRVFVDNRPFNFASINNLAVDQIESELICLLNDDTEVISSGWLNEMVGHISQPNVGAVGAKLLYPNDRIQHAGVILGIGGVAGHAHKHYDRMDDGYFSRLQVTQNLSAVTAACLLTKRSLWKEIGGMDERLSVAFNDIDFCLRVSKTGHSIVWTPWAELYHHESISRGYETTPEKQERFRKEIELMQSRWKEELEQDPHYNPHLTLEEESFRPRYASEY